MTKQQFAKKIKEKREKLEKTQSEFAKMLGVSWITIWRWENEKQVPNNIIMDLWLRHIDKLRGK